MKSIFITGIAGMLGSNIAYLLKEQYNIYGTDLNEFRMQGVISSIFSANDIIRLREQLIRNHIDTVIHCAAMINVNECETNPNKAFQINYELTKNIVTLCSNLGIRVIFISTDCVFDGMSQSLYRETDLTNPTSIYGKTKLAAEKEVLKVDQNLVVRTTIYGYNYRNKLSFGEWILESLINNNTLHMFSDIYFSPILVNELAFLLDRCIKHELSGIYHICGSGAISKYEIAHAIKKEFQLGGMIHKVSIEDDQTIASRAKYRGLCNDKISKTLDIKIRTPLESVKEFKNLYENRYYEALRKDKKV